MATSAEAVRSELATVSTAALAELAAVAQDAGQVDELIAAIRLVVPAYYDAAGSLAVAWYDDLRADAAPSTPYVPRIIGDPATDWIEREVATLERSLAADVDDEARRLINEALGLAEKEVARGFRDSILGNVRIDQDAVGWSRVARSGACKMCRMLADRGAVFTEATALFAAHKHCHCTARPEFRGGDYGPEASVMQYVASSKRPKSEAALAERNARLRQYLNHNYPDLPG